jgi:hypothetical protein
MQMRRPFCFPQIFLAMFLPMAVLLSCGGQSLQNAMRQEPSAAVAYGGRGAGIEVWMKQEPGALFRVPGQGGVIAGG